MKKMGGHTTLTKMEVRSEDLIVVRLVVKLIGIAYTLPNDDVRLYNTCRLTNADLEPD